jgi:adenine-specific DNA-methyltransferase
MSKHKTLGQVFTPAWIVTEILDRIGYNSTDVIDKYIFEPACGDGAFLVEIVERYINLCISHHISENEIIDKLEKYIFAVEIDKIQHQEAIEKLNKIVSSKLKTKTQLRWNIYNQDFFDFYQNYLGFFDFIVGNPPYIRIHNLNSETRAFLKSNFVFAKGTIDLYLSFFEAGLNLLNKNGKLGFITPNSFLRNSSYLHFRNYLLEKQNLVQLIDFNSLKVFKGFSTYTAITIFDNANKQDYFEYGELVNRKIELVNSFKFNDLECENWSFTNKKNEVFLSELNKNNSSLVKNYFDVQYGFATLRDKIFIGKIADCDDELVYFNGHKMEKKLLKKVVKGSKFKGEINDDDRIIFPYKKVNNRYVVVNEYDMQTKFPFAYAYFLHNKEELEKRDRDKKALWYEFGRSQGVQTMHNEKIVVNPLVFNKVAFYKVPADVMIYSGIYILKNNENSSWKMIENVLSSDEFFKFVRLVGKDLSGGYKSITSKMIKNYRI